MRVRGHSSAILLRFRGLAHLPRLGILQDLQLALRRFPVLREDELGELLEALVLAGVVHDLALALHALRELLLRGVERGAVAVLLLDLDQVLQQHGARRARIGP